MTKGKGIMGTDTLPTKDAIAYYWIQQPDAPLWDMGEPSCWACGETWNGKYDGVDAYNKAPLERCHIIPKSLGGCDEVGNLYLLCSSCHSLAPDTLYPEVFLTWCKAVQASKYRAWLYGIEEIGITPQQAAAYLQSKDFTKFIQQSASYHYGIGLKDTTVLTLLGVWHKSARGV